MNEAMLYDVLSQLCDIPGPSGAEAAVRESLIE